MKTRLVTKERRRSQGGLGISVSGVRFLGERETNGGAEIGFPAAIVVGIVRARAEVL